MEKILGIVTKMAWCPDHWVVRVLEQRVDLLSGGVYILEAPLGGMIIIDNLCLCGSNIIPF